MEVTIITEKREEYEKRVKHVRKLILNAIYCLETLKKLGVRQDFYHKFGTDMMFYPSITLFNAIIRTFQMEAIQIVCILEDAHKNSNSLKRLRDHMDKYLDGYENVQDKLLEFPESIENVKRARDKYIAHTDVKCDFEKINMLDIEKRVKLLKDCFNSYLFAEMKNYEVNDKDIKETEYDAKYGVYILFSGVIEKAFQSSIKQSCDESEG